jgi:hypothetical protein
MTSTSGSNPKPPNLSERLKRVFDASLRTAIIAAILGAIIGSLLTFFIPKIYAHFWGPPSDTIVTNLMEQDIRMAKTGDLSSIQSVYAYNAVVVDSGCKTASQPTIWAGIQNIMNRYEMLPQIVTLDHSNIHINWIPDDSSATMAVATASTTGTAKLNGSSFDLNGNEVWEVSNINGQWLVTSFTFDLC